MLPSIWIELYRFAAAGLLSFGLAFGPPAGAGSDAASLPVDGSGQTVVISATQDFAASSDVVSGAADTGTESDALGTTVADSVIGSDAIEVDRPASSVKTAAPLA